MKEEKKERRWITFFMWFVLLSTFGVGGGIFFLLLAVVPIEQWYTDRAWSQYRIDQTMKYYVFGWVIFGFFVSFLYYKFVLKKKYWKLASVLLISSMVLCGTGFYSFLHTGSGLIQQSQGTVEEGERFTFGPYPEKEELARLKEEGYDGVITLLNPTLPIEQPLLEKEKKNASEAGIILHSLPMLPWVGDNSKSIEEVKKMITQDDKKYYVHCYLGRHRVDVIKQVINQELDQSYKILFLQPTTFERGNLYHFNNQTVLVGPYPTDEEWFTRIKRAEVKEVVSLLREDHADWIEKEKQVTAEMNMTFTPMPFSKEPTLEEIKQVADYVQSLDHKVFIHGFINPNEIESLEAYLSWGKTLQRANYLTLESGEYRKIGEKVIIGYAPTERDKAALANVGIESYVTIEDESNLSLYKQVQAVKEAKQLTYFIVNNLETMNRLAQMTTGVFYGSMTRGTEFENITLTQGTFIREERNFVIGPMLTAEEYNSFALSKGVAQIIYLYSSSLASEEKLAEVKRLAKEHHIPLHVIPMHKGYEEKLVPLLNNENGLNYLMTDAELMPTVKDFIKQF